MHRKQNTPLNRTLTLYGDMSPRLEKLQGFEGAVWQRINMLEVQKSKPWPIEWLQNVFMPLPQMAFASAAVVVGLFSAHIYLGTPAIESSATAALGLNVFSPHHSVPLYAMLKT